ncbi:hypothetical protein ACVWY2_005065 [Bradyrhizobium sp. JR6.1]
MPCCDWIADSAARRFAVQRRGLELELAGGLLHLGREQLLHGVAAAGEEFGRLAHQLAIAGEIDLARAGAGAALDLIEQAGPAAALEEAVGAGADQERALQRRDGAVDRAGVGERAEIASGPRLRAAMLENLRRPMVAGDQNIGKRLVVAQLHIEARPELLDQIGFEQQRLGLGHGRDDLDMRGRRDHAQDARRQRRVGPRIGRQPLFDVLRLADIEHVVGGVEHAVDAGRGRGEADRVLDRLMPDRERPLGDCLGGVLRCLGKTRVILLLGGGGFRIDVARVERQVVLRQIGLWTAPRLGISLGGRRRTLGRIVNHGP